MKKIQHGPKITFKSEMKQILKVLKLYTIKKCSTIAMSLFKLEQMYNVDYINW